MWQKCSKVATKASTQTVLDNEEKRMLNNVSNGSDSDCILVTTRK